MVRNSKKPKLTGTIFRWKWKIVTADVDGLRKRTMLTGVDNHRYDVDEPRRW